MSQVKPIIIYEMGASGRVMDAHMGVLINGKPKIIPNIDSYDQLKQAIKNKDYLKK